MIFTYDMYKKLKQSKLYLANPQKNYIGVIGGVKQLTLTINLNQMSEATFRIYKTENNAEKTFYPLIENKRLIEIQYVGWFQIQNAKETDDGMSIYKDVSCISLENELVGKRINNLDGVYALYDITDTDNSLLHIIAAECGWNIGHVDNDLRGKYRTLSIDSEQIYNYLTTDISSSFECIFQFDTYDKTINAYRLTNVGNLTDIFISRKNIMKEYIRESKADDIVTKLKVVGADDVDIRAVNPTGTNYLINVDYFKTTEWMSQGLIDALDTYEKIYNGTSTLFKNTLSDYKTLNSELTTLYTELTDLNSELTAQEDVQGAYIEQFDGTPKKGTAEYTLYIEAVNKIASLNSQISNKEDEINGKEADISSLQEVLDNISSQLDFSNFFNQEQLKELNVFITENDVYEDSTFVATDTMTEEEIIEMKLELMSYGASELARVSKPQYTINISASNLFAIRDDDTSSISFDKWRENLEVGNLITIKFRDNFWSTARLIQLVINFDNLEDMELTLSDKTRDDEYEELSSLIADAGKASSALSLKEYGYDSASKITSSVVEFMNGTLNATLNKMTSNDNQDILIDKYGIHMRKWLEDQNKYSDYQAWWCNTTLLFSSDGFKSAQMGIGQFTTEAGETFYGLIGEAIISNIIISEALTVKNINNTFYVNKDGAFLENAEFVITRDNNTILLNPSDGFTILKDNEKAIWLGTNGDAYFKGNVTASKITSSKFTCTNGINTVEIDPDSGDSIFTVSKGNDKQIWFDDDGNAVFEGHMTIGKIYSQNYVDSNGSEGSMINLESGSFQFANDRLILNDDGLTLTNKYSGNWMGLGQLDYDTNIEFKNGYLKILNKSNNRDLYFLPEGISTNYDAQNATGVISFFSKMYGSDMFGITMQTNNSPIALRSLSGNILIHPEATAFPDNNFVFGCDNNTGEGIVMFGDFVGNEYSVGIKMSKDSSDPTIWITDNTRGKVTGNIVVNELRSKTLNIDSDKIIYDSGNLSIESDVNITGYLNLNNKSVATSEDLDSLETEWKSMLQISYNNGYDTGYDIGYGYGYSTGYSKGYSKGYSAGYNSGSSSN